MPNFGITDLPFRQADIDTRCRHKAMRTLGHQLVKDRRFGKRDSIMRFS
jgi:hypothetical protein